MPVLTTLQKFLDHPTKPETGGTGKYYIKQFPRSFYVTFCVDRVDFPSKAPEWNREVYAKLKDLAVDQAGENIGTIALVSLTASDDDGDHLCIYRAVTSSEQVAGKQLTAVCLHLFIAGKLPGKNCELIPYKGKDGSGCIVTCDVSQLSILDSFFAFDFENKEKPKVKELLGDNFSTEPVSKQVFAIRFPSDVSGSNIYPEDFPVLAYY